MTRLQLGAGVLAAIIASGLIAAHVTSASPNDESRVLRRLETLQLRNTDTEVAVVKLRYGLLHNYDSLARLAGELEQHRIWLDGKRLEELPRLAASVDAAFIKTSEALTAKLVLVEEFKTVNALLRNSLHYFPGAADAAIAAQPSVSAIAALRALRDVVLSIPLEPTAERYGEARRLAENVRNRWQYTSQWTAIQSLTDHADAIVRLHKRAEELTHQIAGGSAEPLGRNLVDAYRKRLESVIARSTAYRYLLIGTCLALLAYAALAYFRLRRSARLLDTSQQFLGDVADTLTDGVYALDKDGRCTFVNSQAELLLGRDKDELLGRVLHEDTDYRTPEGTDPAAGLTQPVQIEDCTYRRPDGTILQASAAFAPLRDGAVLRGCVGAFRDVAQRRQAEAELKESEERFRTLSTLSSDWYWEQDEEFRFTLMSSSISTGGRGDPQDYLGRTRWDLPSVEMSEEDWRDHKMTLAEHRPFQNFILKREDQNRAIRYYSISGQPMFNTDGVFRGYRGVGKEVTAEKTAEFQLLQTNADLQRHIEEQQQRTNEIAILSDFGRLLQSCVSVAEAYQVIGSYCGRIFPEDRGALYIKAASGHFLDRAIEWHEPQNQEQVFAPDECWGLRRGQMHVATGAPGDVICGHLAGAQRTHSHLCAPVAAQNETIGLLYVEMQSGASSGNSRREQIALMVSEQIALTLANLKLRENLKNQSVRDPLTGLYNRRYLEESLHRELARAQRSNAPLAVLMLDIDNFKRYNDVFGHSAGDTVIQTLGRLLRDRSRKVDIACRYGGEEFLLLMPGANLDVALERAEAIRLAVEQLELTQNGSSLGTVSISAGISAYPDHSTTAPELVKLADSALYRAKRSGRNRVLLADSKGLDAIASTAASDTLIAV